MPGAPSVEDLDLDLGVGVDPDVEDGARAGEPGVGPAPVVAHPDGGDAVDDPNRAWACSRFHAPDPGVSLASAATALNRAETVASLQGSEYPAPGLRARLAGTGVA